MQTIYIDVLLCVNIFIDYCILLSTQKFLHIQKKQYRLIIGSMIASVFSLTVFLPKINFILSFIIKLIIACIVVFITFGKCNYINYLKRVMFFMVVSFCFAGIMILIHLTLKPGGLLIKNNVVYFNISPIMLITITIIAYIVFRLAIRLIQRNVKLQDIYTVEIKNGDLDVTFNGRVDTGCSVKEPFSGAPVIIAEKELLCGYETDEKSLRIIPFNSLGGTGIIKGFKCDEIYINSHKIEKDVYLGICENLISGEIKCLIGNDII